MRIATLLGRSVLVSPDGRHALDIADASAGRFGPQARDVFEAWEDFLVWTASSPPDFDAAGEEFDVTDLGAPSDAPRQVFAIGLNYRDHADESGFAYPEHPPTFTKFLSSFSGPVTDLVLPNESVDWEAELVVVIGRGADRVPADQAWEHVAGLTVGQDFSDRVLQLTGPAPQFSLGKSHRGFAPQGPWLVTLDEVADPNELRVTCVINGSKVQDGSTAQMIFPVAAIIERLSAVAPLLPGDVIFTGTPAGVGGGRKPPVFLKPGDVVETEIEGIGSLRQTCVAAS